MTSLLESWYAAQDEETRYLFDERAAVYEYEAGMDRAMAERCARIDVARMKKECRIHG